MRMWAKNGTCQRALPGFISFKLKIGCCKETTNRVEGRLAKSEQPWYELNLKLSSSASLYPTL